jgi:hypothetical protein
MCSGNSALPKAARTVSRTSGTRLDPPTRTM